MVDAASSSAGDTRTGFFRAACLCALVGSLAVLGGNLLLIYAGITRDCALCRIERWPFGAAALVLLLVPFLEARRVLARAALAVSVLLCVLAAGLALYHVALERQWLALPRICGGPAASIHAPTGLGQMLSGGPLPCDAVQARLLRLPLAVWNGLAGLILAAAAALGYSAAAAR